MPLALPRRFTLQTRVTLMSLTGSLAATMAMPWTALAQGAPESSEWRDLFNGEDLSGWETWIGPPHQMEGPTIGPEQNPEGDSEGVFSVVDGELKVSGNPWGGVSTLEHFENYHLRMDHRWGEAKYPPRHEARRDSGILFHAQLPHGQFWGLWMGSCEYQVQEQDFGDYFRITLPTIDAMIDPETNTYDPEGEVSENHGGMIVASVIRDAPHGEWNRCEIIARNDEAVHIINGLVVNRLYRIRRSDNGEPLTSGRIEIQSEAAECYYRNIQLRPLSASAIAGEVPEIGVINGALTLTQAGENGAQPAMFTNTSDEPIEIIAAELFGPGRQQFDVTLPTFPIILQPGERLAIPVWSPNDTAAPARLRVETPAGPSSVHVDLTMSP